MQDKELVVDLVRSYILGGLCISVISGIKSRWCNVVWLGGPSIRSSLQKASLQPAFPQRRWESTSHSEKLFLTPSSTQVEHLPLAHRLRPWHSQGIAVTSGRAGGVGPFEYLKSTRTCRSAFILLLALASPVSGHAQESSRSTPCPSPGAVSPPEADAQVRAQHCCCLRKAACGPVQTPGTIPTARKFEPPLQAGWSCFWWISWKDIQ